MQNAAIPPNSIPQVSMTHLSGASQGGVILPNGQVALVGFPDPMRDHGPTAFLRLAWLHPHQDPFLAFLHNPAIPPAWAADLGIWSCRSWALMGAAVPCRCPAWRTWASML